MSVNNHNGRDVEGESKGDEEHLLNHQERNNVNCHQVNSEKSILKTTEDLEDLYNNMPLTEETTCGYWIFKGPFFQRFANKKAYVFLYGVVGCIFSATYAYFNGTITTLEKRYKIPSKNTGILSVGNDISTLFISAILSYYGGKGHRPRWIAFGLFTIVLFCVLTGLPHIIYGPGENALSLTTEYGATFDENTTHEVMEAQKMKTLCKANRTMLDDECETEEGNLMPQIILFLAQLISGVGSSLYYTLGVSYMDDNVKKSKTPALISLSYFLRMLGPAIGYALASVCLKMYISPSLTPTINNTDPRWLGAWWLGWFILAGVLIMFSFLIGLFPKILPRAAVRKRIAVEKARLGMKIDEEIQAELPASVKDMITTFKRLVSNNTLMLNNLASIFYFFGYMPYWIFTPKYIETQYRQSASVSSLVTGTVALVFSAVGVLLSGIVISKFRPRARYMAAWNVLVGALSVVGMIGYVFLGCPANDNSMVTEYTLANTRHEAVTHLPMNFTTCNSNCHCDYVKYSPVCGADGKTFISACHAGCKQQILTESGKIFTDCSCVSSRNQSLSFGNYSTSWEEDFPTQAPEVPRGGFATPGSCPVDCYKQFYLFLIVMCFIKFTGATGRASNFLVSVRCVEEKDKPVAMGFSLMIMSLFSFIPSPIFFGAILDKTCLVWGKTCTGTGNCWLYDGESLRYLMNFTAAVFVIIGTLFDCGVWFYVKDLKIFDDEANETELKEVKKEEKKLPEKQ
ncbi:solute carrier organic anion transporter family member 74D-like [Phlebotomus argentipes]|uniref:solute carrier organic anion transporter family member 74D-like n=1 Tax=Phlebotomus argentipes TaxID=94469 RepID=UPI002892E03C|nr:solute carrier organic anion transporter family member 74D-like [Phlebotomus argentipes]